MKLLAPSLAAVCLAPLVAAQGWVLEFQNGAARLQPGLSVQGGTGPGEILRGVADDGRGGTLGAFELVASGTGELRLDGATVTTFAAPALDVDLTGEREALVAAGEVWSVDLDTGVATSLWTPSPSLEVVSVAGVCGGSFYAITRSPVGSLQLVHFDGTSVTTQPTAGTALVDVDCTWDGSSVIYAADASVHLLGAPAPLYTAFLGIGDSIAGVAIDEEGHWAAALDTGSFSVGEVVIDGVTAFTWANQYPGDIDAISAPSTQVPRYGFPTNPPALFATSTPPALGETWTPVIDHTFFAPTAPLDFVAVSVKAPIQVVLPGIGTLLCQPPPPSQILVAPAGQPIAVPMPSACDFGRLRLCVQGGSFGSSGIQLTNALDLTVGL